MANNGKDAHAPFGTQGLPPIMFGNIRVRDYVPDEDERETGRKLEQERELLRAKKREKEQRKHLLSLINPQPGEPSAQAPIYNKPQSERVGDANASNLHEPSATLHSQLFTQLEPTVTTQLTPEQSGYHNEAPTSLYSQPPQESITSTEEAPCQAFGEGHVETPNKGQAANLHTLAAGCEWLTGLDFSRDAFKVDQKQMSLLQREESWQKPPPGKTFPVGNVPISILTMAHRHADEEAASGARPESEDEMGVVASPQSVEFIEGPPGLATQASPAGAQEPPPSSARSWSPTPSPPKLPPRDDQDLPPDSSFDHVGSMVHLDLELAGRQDQAAKANRTTRKPRYDVLSSSPPPRSAAEDPEEDMEMESYIPQALGDDYSDSPRKTNTAIRKSSMAPAESVMQIKETPYLKRRSYKGPASSQAEMSRTQGSGPVKNASSGPIVHATYNDEPTDKDGSMADKSTAPKRKLEASGLGDQCSRIRRKIKTGDFGGDDVPYADPAIDFNQHREKSRKIYNEMQGSKRRGANPGTTESTSNIGSEHDSHAMDGPLQKVSTRVLLTESQTTLDESNAFNQNQETVQNRTTRTEVEPLTDDAATDDGTTDDATTDAEVGETSQKTVFDTFKTAYPEYEGDEVHFSGMCTQIFQLEMEDRMVPKWQWDDYIIRSLTEFAPYVDRCLARGRPLMSYIKYYKDNVCDTIFPGEVFCNKSILHRALYELNVDLFESEQLIPPYAPAAIETRTSLRSVSAHPRASRNFTSPTNVPGQARHSSAAPSGYSTSTSKEVLKQTRQKARVCQLQGPKSRLAQIIKGKGTSGPGSADRYRDFVFKDKKKTSVVGTAEVSGNNANNDGAQTN